MPGKPAARLSDNVTPPHVPPNLAPGPGSPNVLIGFQPAWRGIPAAAVAGLQSAKKSADAAIESADKSAAAAAGTPGAPAAKAAAETAKAATAAAMAGAIMSAAAGADIHTCSLPLPIPPHGPGVVIDGSKTVFVNFLPACRMGDTILEAVGPPNKIAKGEPTVMIGDSGGGGGGGAPAFAFSKAAESGSAFVCKGPCEACDQL